MEELVDGKEPGVPQKMEKHNPPNEPEFSQSRLNQQEYQLILQTSMDGFLMVDPEGVFLEVNRAASRLLGYSRQELLGMRIQELEAIETPQETQLRRKKVMETGSARFPTSLRCKDGSLKDIEVSLAYTPAEGGRFFVFLRDISRQKQAELALEQSEAKYRNYFQTSKDCVFITNKNGEIENINQAGAKMLGFRESKEVLGTNVQKFYAHPQVREEFIRRIEEKGFVKDWSFELKRKDGVVLSCLLTAVGIKDEAGNFVRYQGTLRDITHLKNLEQQLLQVQKMEAIGNLTGGIAHNFNNLLTIMLGNLELAKLDLPAGHPVLSNLEVAEKAGQRAAHLIKHLLDFAHPRKAGESTLSLNKAIKDSLAMLDSLIPAKVKVETDFTAAGCLIKGEAAMLTLVLMDLIFNAWEAMPQGGKLRLKTEVTVLGQDSSRLHLSAAPGEYAVLNVSDTGVGIKPVIKDRIFEPFFTTKKKAMGTGLGLAMVYSLVKKMGGWVQVESQPDQGAEFKLYFPRLEGKGQKTIPP